MNLKSGFQQTEEEAKRIINEMINNELSLTLGSSKLKQKPSDLSSHDKIVITRIMDSCFEKKAFIVNEIRKEKFSVSRPTYIPEEIFNYVLFHMDCIPKHSCSTGGFSSILRNYNKKIEKLESNRLSYFLNYINSENDSLLKEYFLEFKQQPELLKGIISRFDEMVDWQIDFKLTPTEKVRTASKLAKSLLDAAIYTSVCPDTRLALQLKFEDSIKSAKSIGTKGNPTTSKKDTYPDLKRTLRDLSALAADLEASYKTNKGIVRKVNAPDAHLHFLIRRLRDTFVRYDVPTRKHVSLILSLIEAIMGSEDVDEPRVRRILNFDTSISEIKKQVYDC